MPGKPKVPDIVIIEACEIAPIAGLAMPCLQAIHQPSDPTPQSPSRLLDRPFFAVHQDHAISAHDVAGALFPLA